MSAERFPFENGLFHVTNRGVDRRNIMLDDHDRKTWLRLLGRNAEGRAQMYRIQNWRGGVLADGKSFVRQF